VRGKNIEKRKEPSKKKICGKEVIRLKGNEAGLYLRAD